MKATVMKTAKPITFVGLVAVALLGSGVFAPRAAQAQDVEVSGPLAGSPSVIALRAYRQMRFQIQLQSTMTLQDEFSRAVLFGGQLAFHPTDWLGIGVWGGFAPIHIDTTLTDEVTDKGQTNQVNVLSLPNADNFDGQIGQIKWIAAPQLSFIPLRGKIGIFEALFVDVDFYILAGAAFAGVDERKDVTGAQFNACRAMGGLADQIRCFSDSQDDTTSRVSIAPTAAFGFSFYMADFVALTFEYRVVPFSWNASGTDEAGAATGDFPDGQINSDDRLLHLNQMMTLGFAFYLPTHPRLTHKD
jgi:hypothetical protein